jgi:hypothetical protein
MRNRIEQNRIRLIVALTAMAAGAFAVAQAPGKQDWVGIWQANVGGKPSGTLTLAADTGELGGTLVLDMVSDEGGTPHVIASEPHVLMQPRVDGNVLSFGVKTKRTDAAALANFTVTLVSPGKANIHCTNCGADAPVVELSKNP